MNHPYLMALAGKFEKAARTADALFMKKYMLGQFDYFGIRSPQRKIIFRDYFQEFGFPDVSLVPEIVESLFEQPEREFHYFAIELSQKMLKKMKEPALETIEFMITTKSWWDTVDWIASHHAGTYFKNYPEKINDCTGRWMDSGNMWLQRSALLFQLKYKKNTDEELMFACIRQLSGSKEFFIRKAIGWILREYSKTNSASVIQFVENTNLSGLSRREALKWLKNKGQL
jgi:3-methyladenine DNA glycosylase AlkD